MYGITRTKPVGYQWVEHFEEDGAKTPPVHTPIVGLFSEHLWSEVLWRATESVGRFSLSEAFFAESKIGQDDVAVRIE